MSDSNRDLPEGTDKIVPGASNPTNTGALGVDSTGSASAGNDPNGGDVLIIPDPEVDVVGGGAGTGGATGTAAMDATGAAAGAMTGGDASGSGMAGSTGGSSVVNRLRSSGKDLSGQAAGKARDLVGQGLERGSETLTNFSRLIGDTASGLDERLGPEYGDYARRAATAIENAANNLASKDAEVLIEDTRQFVRKSPGVALAGAAVIGFALARLVKSGLSGPGGDTGSDYDTRRRDERSDTV